MFSENSKYGAPEECAAMNNVKEITPVAQTANLDRQNTAVVALQATEKQSW